MQQIDKNTPLPGKVTPEGTVPSWDTHYYDFVNKEWFEKGYGACVMTVGEVNSMMAFIADCVERSTGYKIKFTHVEATECSGQLGIRFDVEKA